MLPKILLAVAAIAILFVIIVALRPGDFRVTRSSTIAAPPQSVFSQVNDFHNWELWSPWAKIDASMQQTYEGAASGTGAIYTWRGNAQVGQGEMRISESRPYERINIDLEFIKPFPGKCPTEFTFHPQGRDTLVTWTMTGRHTFIPKAVGLFVNMDQMIGSQFEKGLAQMKALSEGVTPSAPVAATPPVGR